MFKNRISVVNRAKNAGKSPGLQISSSTDSKPVSGSAAGDNYKSSPSLVAAGSGALSSVAAETANETGIMEHSHLTDEGVCVNELFFAIEDSGEIRENELLLDDDDEDENDVTKDLDFSSKHSPSLFSVASNTPVVREEAISNIFFRNVAGGFNEQGEPLLRHTTERTSDSYGDTPMPKFLVPQEFKTPNPSNAWVVAETPQSLKLLPAGQTAARSPSDPANMSKRRSIASAINELHAMSAELSELIKSLKEKQSSLAKP